MIVASREESPLCVLIEADLRNGQSNKNQIGFESVLISIFGGLEKKTTKAHFWDLFLKRLPLN